MLGHFHTRRKDEERSSILLFTLNYVLQLSLRSCYSPAKSWQARSQSTISYHSSQPLPIITVCSKLQTLGTILNVGWALKNLIDEVMEDVASSPLPLNENGLDYWRNKVAVAAYYDIGPLKKQAKIRMHTVVSTCIAIGLCIQFMQIIRMKYIDLHCYV
eukprot:scaffold90658_cov116-Cyclotella_meneghiniana.AAC.4